MAGPSPTAPRQPDRVARPSNLSASEVDTADWPVQAADTIERVVQGVRDKTTGPAITAARWVVAGLFLAVLGTTAGIVLIIMAVRLLDAYLPVAVFGEDHIWAAYGILGGLISLVGAIVLSRRSTPTDDA